MATFIDLIAPVAVQDIGTMMARHSGSMLAVPDRVMDEIESSFRQRFTELVELTFD